MAESLPEVYLVRHGATAYSTTGRHAGHTDLALTEAGEKDAIKVRQRLAGLKFGAVFVSPLQRARRSCELAGFLAEAVVTPDLAEWDYGDYEGQLTAETRAKRPGWDLFRDGCPGGDSVQAISDRADRLLATIRGAKSPCLLFGHSQIFRVLAARWLGLPAGFGRHLVLSTSALSILSFDHELTDPAITLWNDTHHLKG